MRAGTFAVGTCDMNAFELAMRMSSYVSMKTALRYYGLIPEAVYTTQSMTLKHSFAISQDD